MIVVIDGYNLLKQLFPGKGPIDKQRDYFVRQLGLYHHKKKNAIKEIIVVFDAGPFRHATREVKHGIVVVFSGQRSNADTWIIEFVERKKNEELLVITMDRKLIEACGKHGAHALSSLEFYHLMQKCILENTSKESPQQATTDRTLEKYKPIALEDEASVPIIDRQAFDLLMEQESLHIPKNMRKDDEQSTKTRKGSSSMLSKEEKKAYATIKKLR